MFNPMYPYIQNAQDYLAEKCLLMDSHNVQASKIAFLKIQSWKFSLKTPEVGVRYQQEAEDMVKQSFLTYVPNSFVLSEEGFHFSEIEN